MPELKREFYLFGPESCVGLDDLLKQLPEGVEPQDVSLDLVLRGVDTDLRVSWIEVTP